MVNEYSQYELIPNAHLLLSSLRSMGYTEETAVADIVDNCIAAGAKNINIIFSWESKRIVIYDDGDGMSKKDLLNGMKIGSSDPTEDRSILDLGRFGMGMKTATFSIGKKLTVISKENNIFSNASWDLEYVEKNGKWNVLIVEDDSKVILEAKDYLKNRSNGTMVIIENLDKLIDKDNLSKSKSKFYSTIKKVRNHIALVFHRFIEEDDLLIKVNEKTILPWNPFALENVATQELSEEEYYQGSKHVVIEPYILPHKTKFENEDEFNLVGGPKGWQQHQGFYVYRNRRLLVYGTWFNKIRKEPSFNLARIKLDITSYSDFDWNIDIKKSKATPPIYLDDLIEQVIEIATEKSAKVYNSRGTYSKNTSSNLTSLKYVWEQRKTSSGKYMFYLNKKHPVLMNLFEKMDKNTIKELKSFLTLVENYAPSVLSGIIDTLSSEKESEVDQLIREKDIIEIKEKIDVFRAIGFGDEEILDTFSNMTEYIYLYSETKKILLGE